VRRRLLPLLVALAGLAAAALRWRRNPTACPYSQRWSIDLPRPFLTRARLVELLDPQPGERLLELGPGTGYYTLDVAERLGKGRLEVFDLQQEMLDHVSAKARERGVENVVPWQGDARDLLFEADRFDGAFLVTVLGEIPDQDAALRELARVVKPGGRVVFGEIALDPHMVTLRSLTERGERAGLRLDRRVGSPLAYVARFEVASAG
jgi:ubiquinone/menaquinone biosynthesis C-methylase UbiE